MIFDYIGITILLLLGLMIIPISIWGEKTPKYDYKSNDERP